MKPNLFTASALGAFLALSSSAVAGSSELSPVSSAAPAVSQSEGRPMIGVLLKAGSGSPVIETVVAGSPAEAAGLKSGDVITSVGGVKTDSLQALRGKLGGLAIGDEVAISVQRGADSKEFKLSLADSSKLDLPEETVTLVEEVAPQQLEEVKVGKDTEQAKQAKALAKAAGKAVEKAKKAEKQGWVIEGEKEGVSWTDISEGHATEHGHEHGDTHVIEIEDEDGKRQIEVIVGSGGGAPIRVHANKPQKIKVDNGRVIQFGLSGGSNGLVGKLEAEDCNGACCEEAAAAQEECCLTEEVAKKPGKAKVGGHNGFTFEVLDDGSELITEISSDECGGGCCEEAGAEQEECCETEECEIEIEQIIECDSVTSKGGPQIFFQERNAHGNSAYAFNFADEDKGQMVKQLKDAGLDAQAIKEVLAAVKKAHGKVGDKGHATFEWKEISKGGQHVVIEEDGHHKASTPGMREVVIVKSRGDGVQLKDAPRVHSSNLFDAHSHGAGHGNEINEDHQRYHNGNIYQEHVHDALGRIGHGEHEIHGAHGEHEGHGAHDTHGHEIHEESAHGTWQFDSGGDHAKRFRLHSKAPEGHGANLQGIHERVMRELKAAGVSPQMMEKTMKQLAKAGIHPEHKAFKGKVFGNNVFEWKAGDGSQQHDIWTLERGNHDGPSPDFRLHTAPQKSRQAPKAQQRRDNSESEIHLLRQELQNLRAELRDLRASMKRRR